LSSASTAAQGFAEAQCNLGVFYYEGKGVSQDYAEAARLYRLAAAQGHAEGQYSLGCSCFQGKGVPQNAAEGARFWRLAAAQGHDRAQFSLGVLLFEGKDVSQDFVEAARLWRSAVAQGHPEAHFSLGALSFQGSGVPQDFVEAARLRRLAAAQGSVGACEGLKVLASRREYVSVCCMARFCNAECQQRVWAEHKPHCKRWVASDMYYYYRPTSGHANDVSACKHAKATGRLRATAPGPQSPRAARFAWAPCSR
jgi:TPR repeat protein